MMKPLEGTALMEKLSSVLDQHKAEMINPINLAGKSDMADYMLIANGTSSRHLQALASYLQDELKVLSITGVKPEGSSGDEWVVIDAYSVIVHLFSPECRAYYDLDKMWGTPV